MVVQTLPVRWGSFLFGMRRTSSWLGGMSYIFGLLPLPLGCLQLANISGERRLKLPAPLDGAAWCNNTGSLVWRDDDWLVRWLVVVCLMWTLRMPFTRRPISSTKGFSVPNLPLYLVFFLVSVVMSDVNSWPCTIRLVRMKCRIFKWIYKTAYLFSKVVYLIKICSICLNTLFPTRF